MDSLQTRLIDKLIELDDKAHKGDNFANNYSSYGRGVEQVSGLGLWLAAYALLTNPIYFYGDNSNFFGAVLLFCVGFCQLYYSKMAQRVVFTPFASMIWLAGGIHCYTFMGNMWTMGMAAQIPLGIANFYVFGFVYNEVMEMTKRRNKTRSINYEIE